MRTQRARVTTQRVMCPCCLRPVTGDLVEHLSAQCPVARAAGGHFDDARQCPKSPLYVLSRSVSPTEMELPPHDPQSDLPLNGSITESKPTVNCDQCGGSCLLHATAVANEAWILAKCSHTVCRVCVGELRRSKAVTCGRMNSVPCPVADCRAHIVPADLRTLFPATVIAALEAKELETFLAAKRDHLVTCPKCNVLVELPSARSLSSPPMTQDCTRTTDSAEGGQLIVAPPARQPSPPPATLLAERDEHFNTHRVRCYDCRAVFCSDCLVMPYHDGFTCEQFRTRALVLSCRFCTAVVPDRREERSFFDRLFRRRRAPRDVCAGEDCVERGLLECDKSLPCGHPCYSPPDEACGACLVEGCAANTTRQTATDLCTICYVDELRVSSVAQLDCGHAFHVECLRRKLQSKWPAARITFGFLNCPTCGQTVQCAALRPLVKALVDYRQLVRAKMLTRVKHEGLLESPKLADPKSPFYQNPLALAEATLAYYQCFKCTQPYFGGYQQCEVANDDDRSFDAEHLICSGCVPDGDFQRCQIHGTDFIEYKCKYCCTVATWYCWGKTHFCTACHRRQERGDYVTKIPLELLPQCGGPRDCPLQVSHPRNGTTEMALGCSICRREAPELH
jgi:hypothetical protein